MTARQVASAGDGPVNRAAMVALILLTLTNVLNYLDRTLIAALSQPIKAEFGLSDTELGLLSGFAFVALYAAAGLPIARLADRTSRKAVIVASLATWSVLTAACGLAQSFFHLVCGRVGIGVGEAGCLPASHSLLADLFPQQQRSMVLGIFTAGNMVGITAGLTLGAWIGALYGWRAAFLLLGLPGLILSVVLYFSISEPTRGRVTGGASNGLSFRGAMSSLAGNRAFVWLALGTGLNAFLTYGMTQWLPQFFYRVHGYSLAQLGSTFGLTFGAGLTVGVLTGGWLGDRLARRGTHWPMWLCVAASLLLVPIYTVVLLVDSGQVAVTLVFLAAAVNGLVTPQMVTLIQNVSPVETRATASSISAISGSILGVGLGPAVIGMASDALTPHYGVLAIRTALLGSLGICLISAAVYAAAARAISRGAKARTDPLPLSMSPRSGFRT